MKNYELAFEVDFDLYVREFDTVTRKSSIIKFNNDKFVPEVYIPSQERTSVKSFSDGRFLERKQFKNTYEYHKFKKHYTGKMYGNLRRTQCMIRQRYPHQIGFNPKEKAHNMRTWFLDIEVRSTRGYAKPSSPTEAICTIQIYDNYQDMILILSVEPEGFNKIVSFKSDLCKLKYVKCESEYVLLQRFTEVLNLWKPTVICGFNSNFFDIPYITNRMDEIGMDITKLSPVREIREFPSKTFDGIEYIKKDWKGIIFMDYRDLYQKYIMKKVPKYSLEVIAREELGEGKVSHSEYDNLEELYNKDFEKFIQYSIRDVEILVELDKKLKGLETAKQIAYLCGVSMTEVGGTLLQWQSLMYNTALQKGLILPVSQEYSEECPYVGGWVKATPGKHKMVFSYDFTSLYPSNIRALSIGIENYLKPTPACFERLGTKDYYPDDLKEVMNMFNYYRLENTEIIKSENDNPHEFKFFKTLMDNKDKIIPVLKKYNLSVAPNCTFYFRETSVLEELMTKVFNMRVEAKRMQKETTGEESEYWEFQQSVVLKILMNSCYGSLALPNNNFSFGQKQSAAITTTGRLFNRWVAYRVNEFLGDTSGNVPYTVQADTDSNYFKFGEHISSMDEAESFLNEKIQPIIDKAIKEVEELLNVYKTGILGMEQESKFDTFLSFAPKRYIGRKKPGEYKFTGVSIIDKSTPSWSKEKLRETLPILMDGTPKELVDYVEGIKSDFRKAPLDTICNIKSVSSLDYKEKTPNKFYNSEGNPAQSHARGSIIHNKYINDKGLVYNQIIPGDKVYILYMKPHSSINYSNAFCFKNPLIVTETELGKFIDYDTMFKKSFVSKLETMTEPLNISLNPYQGQLDLWEM